MTDELEDRRLVKRLLAHDREAFTAFFDGYFPRLYRFARTRLGEHRKVWLAGDRTATPAARRTPDGSQARSNANAQCLLASNFTTPRVVITTNSANR